MTTIELDQDDSTAPASSVELTMLNVMGGTDFTRSLERHRAWGMRWVDLKDALYGKDLKDLTVEDAQRIADALREYDLRVYCMSTVLLGGDASKPDFGADDLADLDHILRLADVLKPRFVRLLAAQYPGGRVHDNAVEHLMSTGADAISTYQSAIDRIANAGYATTIENEAWECLVSTTEEFRSFFQALDRAGKVTLTWDAQNQWATGVMPTVPVYEDLKDLIGYYHVKGGRSDGGRTLDWNVALEEATWPVLEVTQRIVDDGVSPVICLNPPSHGKPMDGYEYGESVTVRDLAFLRRAVQGIR